MFFVHIWSSGHKRLPSVARQKRVLQVENTRITIGAGTTTDSLNLEIHPGRPPELKNAGHDGTLWARTNSKTSWLLCLSCVMAKSISWNAGSYWLPAFVDLGRSLNCLVAALRGRCWTIKRPPRWRSHPALWPWSWGSIVPL